MLRSFKIVHGQGLLEATLAIGIILVGLGALLTLTLQSVAATTASRERVTAIHLGREAIEAVRALRDSNWLKDGNSAPGTAWDAGLIDATACGASCGGAYLVFDPAANPPELRIEFAGTRQIDEPKFKLWQHATYREWSQFSLPPAADYLDTGYRRLIVIDPVCQNTTTQAVAVRLGEAACAVGEIKIGLRVEVTVSWPTPGIFGGVVRRSNSVTEFLYNWR